MRGRSPTIPRRLLVAVAVLALLVGGAAGAADRWLTPDPDGEVLTLLLLGSDGGPPRADHLAGARADGVQLLFVAPDRQHATFVSIPRDSWVAIPGRGNNRINACLNHGPERCVETAESVFGIEVDGYLLTSMRGFIRGVYEFGDIEVDVSRSLVVGYTSVAPGLQRLDGKEALVYARDRKSRPDGDYGRSRAQAELLALAHEQVLVEGDTAAILHTVSVVRRHTVTDIPPAQLVRYGFQALQLPPDNVQRELAPSRLGTAGAASVSHLDPAAYELITDAATDGRIGTDD